MAYDTFGDMAYVVGEGMELRCRLSARRWHLRLERMTVPEDHLFRLAGVGTGLGLEEALEDLLEDVSRRAGKVGE